MVSVAAAYELCKRADKIVLAWGGSTRDVDLSDPITMAAYGDYAVEEIFAVSEDQFEFTLLTRAVKCSDSKD